MLKSASCSLLIGWLIIFVYVTANPTRDLSDNVNIPLKINWETKENEEEKNVSRDKENVLKRDSEDKNNERNKQNFGDVKKRIKRLINAISISGSIGCTKYENLVKPEFENQNAIFRNVKPEAMKNGKRKCSKNNQESFQSFRTIGKKRIVGGYEISIKEIPYQLSLHRAGRFICGASVIKSNWALTAAHCIDPSLTGYHGSDFELRLGSQYSRSGGKLYEVIKRIMHPKFSKRKPINYDAALLMVSGAFDDFLRIGRVGIELTRSAPKPGLMLLVSGWGRLEEYGFTSETLQAVQVPVIDQSTCNKIFSGTIPDEMFCAGNMKGGQDACQGDSGGPIVYKTDDYAILVGIVSHGKGCGRPGNAGVYTSVAAIRDWVLHETYPSWG